MVRNILTMHGNEEQISKVRETIKGKKGEDSDWVALGEEEEVCEFESDSELIFTYMMWNCSKDAIPGSCPVMALTKSN